jgi:hypothetical protein
MSSTGNGAITRRILDIACSRDHHNTICDAKRSRTMVTRTRIIDNPANNSAIDRRVSDSRWLVASSKKSIRGVR